MNQKKNNNLISTKKSTKKVSHVFELKLSLHVKNGFDDSKINSKKRLKIQFITVYDTIIFLLKMEADVILNLEK